tara:strand:- start:296 stop:457 length:162 start_codon:yes stop_codon:yes gene_type:complete
MGFKSKVIPHIEVFKLDGIKCLSFTKKLEGRIEGSSKNIARKRKRKRKVNITA